MFKWIIGLLFGCCSLLLMPTLPPVLFLLGAIVGSILILYLSKDSLSKGSGQPLLRSCLVLLSGCLFGFGWSLLQATWKVSQQIPSPANNSVHIIEAEVVSLPAIYPEYCQFRVKVNQTESPSLHGKSLLLKNYTKNCAYELGEQWWLEIKLKPIHGPVNQAGFDYEFYAFEKRLDGKGYIRESQRLEKTALLSIYSLRQKLYDDLNKHQNAGFLQALLIGEKSNIPKQDSKRLRQLGLSHLVAISGLHISIIAGLFFFLSYQIAGWVNILLSKNLIEPYRTALVISCLGALGYSALADFAIPTVRALIMWCSIAFMVIYRRQGAFLSGLKIALLFILLLDPMAVISVSFWMSFIAVTVISFMLIGRLNLEATWHNKLYRIVKLQLAITLTLIMPSLWFFQQFSITGIVVNIIMIPLFSLVILPLIIVGAVISSVFNINWLILKIDQLISSFLYGIRTIEPYYSVLTFDIYIPAWIVAGLLFLGFLFLLPLPKLKLPFAGLILLLIIFSPLKSLVSDTLTQPKAVVFDVGHGLAVLLTDGQHHILYDTGYASISSDAFQSFIYPSFKQMGIEQLDALILSHKDNDHAGGAKTILNSMPVSKVIAGSWANNKYKEANLYLCQAGYELKIGSFLFKVLHPEADGEAVVYDNNNASCVIHVSNTTNKAFSLLLTGDIEKEVEYKLASTLGSDLEAEVLFVPHHGSNSSSIYPFIKMVNPRLSIYSTERYSRYKMPNDNVINRYNDFAIKQLHTGCLGQITIDLETLRYHYQRQDQHVWRNPACSVGLVND